MLQGRRVIVCSHGMEGQAQRHQAACLFALVRFTPLPGLGKQLLGGGIIPAFKIYPAKDHGMLAIFAQAQLFRRELQTLRRNL